MMKTLVGICLLSLVTMALAEVTDELPDISPENTNPRGCIYVMGRCHKGCPVGTHAYTTGCSHKLPEATCDHPNPTHERGIICDYSACYCDAPTVRDLKTGTCVPLEECSKSE